MKLNYRVHGEGKPLVILHGVFGSADNWQSVGKLLSDYFKVYLVNQRNHGLSPHSDKFGYEEMSDDLLELLDDLEIDECLLLGHSMGGKTVMHFACQHSERVEKAIVVDIAPRGYPPHHQQIFEGFHSLDLLNIKSRGEADRILSKKISDPGVRMFLLKNLTRDENKNFVWKLNLPAIQANILKIGGEIPIEYQFDKPMLFVRGDKSNYIQKSDYSDIESRFGMSVIETITGAGHWVHAEKPQELYELVLKFLM